MVSSTGRDDLSHRVSDGKHRYDRAGGHDTEGGTIGERAGGPTAKRRRTFARQEVFY